MTSPPHWLKPAGKTWSPRVVLSFDTETACETRGGREILTLRCWDAKLRVRDLDGDGHVWTREESGETVLALVDVIEASAALAGEAWVFAHNVGFDLTVTSLPMVLTERKWEPVFTVIGDESCVFVFEKPGQKLVITDSWSWLRTSLQTAAKDVGMRKTRLPKDDDGLSEWHSRCRHDVQILDRLLAELLDWWDQADAGRFSVTSSACAWQTLRRHIPLKAVLAGTDGDRTKAERSAIYGGRKEVWRVGEINGSWIEDWDLVAAHLSCLATMRMPVRPLPAGRLTKLYDPLRPPADLGSICEVVITTKLPCAPVRLDGEVWWPVGTFRTVLTSAELEFVLEVADSVECLSARWYWLTEDLQPWAQWCQGLQSQPDSEVPRTVKRVAKGWGRAVPGRFALRTSELISDREATHAGWAIETGHDLDTGDNLEIITYGGRERTFRKDQDGADVNPAVLAFVEGHLRAAIGRILAARPSNSLLQVNTDGWWETRPPRGTETPEASCPPPWRVVRKETARSVTIQGPNHLSTPHEARLAGIPKDSAVRLDGSYAWHDWPGLRWQLQFSRPGEYTRPGREMMLQDHYCRRWVLTDGETVPVSSSVGPDGVTVILPWSQTSQREPWDVLAEHQVPALALLADDAPFEPPLSLPPRSSRPGRF
jgi:hypothetical protein